MFSEHSFCFEFELNLCYKEDFGVLLIVLRDFPEQTVDPDDAGGSNVRSGSEQFTIHTAFFDI